MSDTTGIRAGDFQCALGKGGDIAGILEQPLEDLGIGRACGEWAAGDLNAASIQQTVRNDYLALSVQPDLELSADRDDAAAADVDVAAGFQRGADLQEAPDIECLLLGNREPAIEPDSVGHAAALAETDA